MVMVALLNTKEERNGCTHISIALDTMFNQMRIAGNRLRMIERYEYIFKQFIEIVQS